MVFFKLEMKQVSKKLFYTEKKIIEMRGQIFHQEPVIEISDQKKFVKTKKNQKIE